MEQSHSTGSSASSGHVHGGVRLTEEQSKSPFGFVEEIVYQEITLLEIVGRGTFGTVCKGQWREKYVAVKLIVTEQERKAFEGEVRQLSRVNHPNIVTLYGACTHPNNVCLVMEYAEGGSLYNVLHCMPEVHYTAAHAISWTLQCARGVAYLHNLKPNALVHRDLKPPNLLLVMGGTVLKICDFGTACDIQTHMTNNKGSAAWMAPEVFESNKYSEKCDVFSWGIILWEVLTRRKPFDDIGGPAFRIMWAVHTGRRPPLIKGCPKTLESLLTRCWDKEPSNRPSMTEVEETMNKLSSFFPGGDQPITYPISHNDNLQRTDTECSAAGDSTDRSQRLATSTSSNMTSSNIHTNVAEVKTVEVGVEHRRTGSDGTASTTNVSTEKPPSATYKEEFGVKASDLQDVGNFPRKTSWPIITQGSLQRENSTSQDLNAYLLLEPKLQPLPPAHSCWESVAIFEEHQKMAQEYLQVQTEVKFLTERREELSKALQEDQQKTSSFMEEYLQLRSEVESLCQLRQSLKLQLELIIKQRQKRPGPNNSSSEDWVVV
ncbi:mitogen-activated protein kinase kinase kinase 7-like isoform X2 [Limulus polyphemus]|uniref:Mitogen-activated protein kinase kinase kinase 7-like isoform X2 n=1 Tax=Limulus polyphemus TaxID=6850 RepID=A0ABM1SJB7_LIMPO|nr:mitogen-activated protein kinase kinase kinase 7-like isoform X2 [Limulus polyphemus]